MSAASQSTVARSTLLAPIPRVLNRESTGWIITGALFAFAFVLRVWGVGWSLPYVVQPDESLIVDAGVRIIKSGDPNPHFYQYPSLVIYLQTAVYALNLLWGTLQGSYKGPRSLPDHNQLFALAPQLYVWGRAFTALVGALTVAGLYRLGRAMLTPAAALVAGLLLLASPMHIEYSHYLVTETVMTACAFATLAVSWALASKPGVRVALLAGAMAGLCTGAKYNGAYVAVVPAIAWTLAWWHKPRPARPVKWLAVGAGMALAGVAAFLITNPYVLLDWPAWSADARRLISDSVPATSLADMLQSFGAQLSDLIESDPVILWTGLLGALMMLAAAVRGHEPQARRAAWLLMPFPIVYMLAMSRFVRIYPRYEIIVLPFLSLTAGYGVSWAIKLAADRIPRSVPWPLRTPASLALVFGLTLIANPVRQMVNFDRYMAAPDSRNLVFNWVLLQLQQGHRFAVELEKWMVCAPSPWSCPAPDVYAPNQPLTAHPPGWYADRGYDYVVLLGKDYADLSRVAVRGWRPPDALAPYLALPQVQHFAGDHEGGKGPEVLVMQTTPDGPRAIKNVTQLGARFGDIAELWGYALQPLPRATDTYDPVSGSPPSRQGYHTGQALGLNLYWRALRDGAGDTHNWTVSVHVTDTKGAVVAQIDVPPMSDGVARPVSAWHKNEYLVNAYNVPLPPTLSPGRYHVSVILYDAPTGPALDVSGPGSAGQASDLGTVVIGP